jgi:UDP-sulfoquinovose synthase
MILGIDGYLGWPLALFLSEKGIMVAGLDNMSRREQVGRLGGASLIELPKFKKRKSILREYSQNSSLICRDVDISKDYNGLKQALEFFDPEVIVHLAEQPSAPFSMLSLKACRKTMDNNILGTINLLYAMKAVCPNAHLVKLGTMGEYGTPNIPIPEGFFDIVREGRKDTLPFPRQAGSWYHQTKVHDSNNIMFACKIWGLKSTDIMQGVVYGTYLDEMGDDPAKKTRLDFDSIFGTAVNRFAVQAVLGHPLTVYGKGFQKRGFIPIQDSIECMYLAMQNPPEEGKYRVINQFEDVYMIQELAVLVRDLAIERGHDCYIEHYENPRVEMEDHFYEPKHDTLKAWGYEPKRDIGGTISNIIKDVEENRMRAMEFSHLILPFNRWDGRKEKVNVL